MKKAAALILALMTALSLTGCASVFDKEYFSSAEYDPPAEDTQYDGATEISSYMQLTLAINNLVSEHGDSVLLRFTGTYDGDIGEDLAAACREVSTGTALGAYAVDYISYDLDRIVAYYEAEVFVYYKRTAEELESIVSVNTESGLYNAICESLANMDESLVAMVGASSLDENAVLNYVDEAYFSDPLACVERPDAVVNVYTGNGFQRIVEIYFEYGATPSVLASRKGVLENSVERMMSAVTSESDAYKALQCLNILISECTHSEDAPPTLWAALLSGESDSEGMALAYKVLCDAAGVECIVVEGRLDRAEHYWNIITIDGANYHVDASRTSELGYGSTFLVNDTLYVGQLLVGQPVLSRVLGQPVLRRADRERYPALGRAGGHAGAHRDPDAGAVAERIIEFIPLRRAAEGGCFVQTGALNSRRRRGYRVAADEQPGESVEHNGQHHQAQRRVPRRQYQPVKEATQRLRYNRVANYHVDKEYHRRAHTDGNYPLAELVQPPVHERGEGAQRREEYAQREQHRAAYRQIVEALKERLIVVQRAEEVHDVHTGVELVPHGGHDKEGDV